MILENSDYYCPIDFDAFGSLSIISKPFCGLCDDVFFPFAERTGYIEFKAGWHKFPIANLKTCSARSFDVGVIFPSFSDADKTLVFSTAGSVPCLGLFSRKTVWQLRDGTWCVEMGFPRVGVDDEAYWVALEYRKSYPDKITGRIVTEERLVRVMREDSGKLKFFQNGNPLSFENVDIYKRRKITERITLEYLFDCAGRLGVDILRELREARPEKSLSYAVLKNSL